MNTIATLLRRLAKCLSARTAKHAVWRRVRLSGLAGRPSSNPCADILYGVTLRIIPAAFARRARYAIAFDRWQFGKAYWPGAAGPTTIIEYGPKNCRHCVRDRRWRCHRHRGLVLSHGRDMVQHPRRHVGDGVDRAIGGRDGNSTGKWILDVLGGVSLGDAPRYIPRPLMQVLWVIPSQLT